MTKKPEDLYNEANLKEAGDEITSMANRFKVRKEDVVLAVWKMGKNLVWAKLEQDVKEKKRKDDEIHI